MVIPAILLGLVWAATSEAVTVRRVEVDENEVDIILGPPVVIPGGTTLYLARRKGVLEKFAKEYPNTTIKAMVSLDSLMHPKEIDKLFENYNLVLLSVTCRMLDSGSGGELGINGSVVDSVKNAVERQKREFESISTEMFEMIEDPKEREEAIRPLKHLIDAFAEGVARGELRIYGIKVRGKLSELQKLQKNERVRLVDIEWSKRAENYERMGYDVDIILVAIPPVFK